MVYKKLLVLLGLTFLFLVPFSFAVENFTTSEVKSLGSFNLPITGQNVTFEDALLFASLFIIVLAIVYEIVNLLGFVEGLVTKLVFSVIFVLLMNFNGFIYRAVFVLKDWQKVTLWITSLTLGNILFGLAIIGLIAFLGVLLRKLIAQWKKDEIREVREQDAIKEGTQRRLRRIKNKYNLR